MPRLWRSKPPAWPVRRSSESISCRDGRGGWVVAELNGAVEFNHEYAPWHDVFAEAASALVREALERNGSTAPLAPLAAPDS